LETSQYYIVYNELMITVCSCLDDVVEELAAGAKLYGYADDENMAQTMIVECFHFLSKRPM
jgi:hypothetical protein